MVTKLDNKEGNDDRNIIELGTKDGRGAKARTAVLGIVKINSRGGSMRSYVERSMTYAGYLQLIDDLLSEGKTTGTNQSDTMKNYAKLNRQRMNRLGKTIELSPEVVFAVRSVERP